MEITFNITEKDLWEFNKYISLRSFGFKLYILLIFLFHLAIILFFFYGTLTIYGIYGLITGDIIGFYLKYSLTKKRLIKDSQNEGTFNERTIHINEEGISIITDTFNKFVKWKAVHKIDILDKYIYILFSSRSGIIVPKRFFNSENEAIQFYNMSNDFFNMK
ncbi:MAG: YcxB family protein [Tepidibacter sp.]|nr:YcxB family protein [Tepidibacter sp.]